jgi:outer membrane receptor protein involved in Fe transport
MDDLIYRVSDGAGGITFANGGKMHFWGLELEGRRYLTPKLYAMGSMTLQESEEDPGINPSLVPNRMGKFGLGYENEAMSIGLFYNYFSTPPSISGAARVNSVPGDIHWISANLNLDVTDWFDLKKRTATLTFRVENLLDEDVYHPEFNRRNINSLPWDSGLALYAGIRLRF